MKCSACQTNVPPTFTKALKANECPACGATIMSKSIFSEFNGVMEKLKDADVDDSTLVRVAALIAGKYDLVPRGSGGRPPVISSRAKIKPKVEDDDDDELEREILQDHPHLADLPEDARRLEILAIRAEVEREFGLSKGDMAAAQMVKSSGAHSDIDFGVLVDSDMPPPLDLPKNNNLSPESLQRLAKAEALRNDPSARAFRRSDG